MKAAPDVPGAGEKLTWKGEVMIRNTVEAGIEPDGTLYEIIEVADPKDPFLSSTKFYLYWPPEKNILRMAELPADHAEENFELAGKTR